MTQGKSLPPILERPVSEYRESPLTRVDSRLETTTGTHVGVEKPEL